MRQNYLLFVWLLLLLSGCIYIRMTHLSKQDLEWIKPYDLSKTYEFVSNEGNVSRMDYTSHHIANSSDPFYFSSKGDCIYEANAGYRFQIKSKADTIDGCFSIIQEYGKEALSEYFSLGARFSNNGGNNIVVPLNIKRFTMGGRTFRDCVIADSTNSRYSPHWSYKTTERVETFVISKKYGLIYYKFEDGEEFFRKF